MCTLEACKRNPFGLYRVQRGDTLRSVCARFSLPPALVAAKNGLRAFPPEGSILLLPEAAGETYLVRPGETLVSVCKKFCMTEEEFSARNGCSYVYPMQLVLVGKE